MINQNIIKPSFKVIDARSRERFEGRVAEPEKLKSGNIRILFVYHSVPV